MTDSPDRSAEEDAEASGCERCPLCCEHGIPLTRNCGCCEDTNDGYLDVIRDDEPMWLCPHGIGTEVRAP